MKMWMQLAAFGRHLLETGCEYLRGTFTEGTSTLVSTWKVDHQGRLGAVCLVHSSVWTYICVQPSM